MYVYIYIRQEGPAGRIQDHGRGAGQADINRSMRLHIDVCTIYVYVYVYMCIYIYIYMDPQDGYKTMDEGQVSALACTRYCHYQYGMVYGI